MIARASILVAFVVAVTMGPAAGAELLDMATIYPGALATTHDLLATDGRRYAFAGDVSTGLWSRSIDPGITDVHVWDSEGMYYLGWLSPGELHWATPPVLAMPRWWDPAIPWVREIPYVVAHRTAAGNTFTETTATVTLRSEAVEADPTLIYYGGGDANEGEHWWLSQCLPVHGGGCAPGFRGYMLWKGGRVTGAAEFTEWVPR